MVEMATGVYPIPPPNHFSEGSMQPGVMTIFELLNYIVNEPPPKLPSGQFSPEFEDMVNRCLHKDPMSRADLHALLNDKWIKHWESSHVDVAGWVQRTIENQTPSYSK